MSFLLAPLLLCLVLPGLDASAEEEVSVQRYLADLYLGDRLEDIQKIYPPAQEWPSMVQSRGHVNRLRVEKTYAKFMPPHVDTMWLGMKKGRLAEIQLIYDAKYTRGKSSEALAADLALIYGKPRFSDGRYWWADGKTVLRVFNAEVPILKDGGTGVELRTSLQLVEAGLFQRTD